MINIDGMNYEEIKKACDKYLSIPRCCRCRRTQKECNDWAMIQNEFHCGDCFASIAQHSDWKELQLKMDENVIT